MSVDEQVKLEYDRIRKLFDGQDEKQIELLEGVFWEAARIRCELNDLNVIKENAGGRVIVSKKNPALQRTLPISKELDRCRASYLNYKIRLLNVLGRNIEDDEDDLADFM